MALAIMFACGADRGSLCSGDLMNPWLLAKSIIVAVTAAEASTEAMMALH
jgi:hypothetical protein